MNEIVKKQISVKEASEIYSIPEWTLRAYIRDKIIFHRRLGRKIYIPVTKFEAWLSAGDVEPDPQNIKQQKKVKERIKKIGETMKV